MHTECERAPKPLGSLKTRTFWNLHITPLKWSRWETLIWDTSGKCCMCLVNSQELSRMTAISSGDRVATKTQCSHAQWEKVEVTCQLRSLVMFQMYITLSDMEYVTLLASSVC